MKKNSAAKRIDFLFVSVVLFLIFYIFYYFYFRKAVYCAVLSFLTLSAILMVYWGVFRKKKAEEKQSAEDKKQAEIIFCSLPYFSPDELNAYFKKLFEKAGYSVSFDTGLFIAEKNDIKKNVYFCFDKPVERYEVYTCERQRRKSGSQGFILLCEEIEEDGLEAANNIDNKYNIVLCHESLYGVMKKYGEYPGILYLGKPKKKGKSFFKNIFKRERFRSYFFLAAIMFLFSFVSPFKNYYLIFSGLLLIFCLFTLTMGNRKGFEKEKDTPTL
jgi:Ca2+/Na+ antiporter